MTPKFLTGFLIATCLILGVLVSLPYQEHSFVNSSKADIKELQTTPDVMQQTSTDISDYFAFTAHPLFNTKRIPYVKKVVNPIIEAAPQPPITIMPPPDLIGILTVNNIDRAFILSDNVLEPTSLKVGDSYKDWELKTIKSTQIVMTYNGIEKIIDMDWQKKEMLDNISGSTDGMNMKITPTDNFIGSPSDMNNENPTYNNSNYLDALPGFEDGELNELKDSLARRLQDN